MRYSRKNRNLGEFLISEQQESDGRHDEDVEFVNIMFGDCVEKIKELSEESVDAIITDPPYELNFMGKKWDASGISYNVDFWKGVLRVLKPGGYLLSFGGSRTYHRMACAIEDAGFEIRDQLMWIYGSGFPKSMDVGKKLDDWEGWGTSLKPAHEPIVMARKPLSEKTVAENVLKWGVGAINIDVCRIRHNEPVKTTKRHGRADASVMSDDSCGFDNTKNDMASAAPEGRFPANVIHDGSDEVLGHFPELKSQGHWAKSKVTGYGDKIGTGTVQYLGVGEKDNSGGSAAKFFYCAKVSSKERNFGCDGLSEEEAVYPGANTFDENGNRLRKDGSIIPPLKAKNSHPTVKPITLMEYLIKLVTREKGVVLDPFMGSGTTGIACVNLNRFFIGIEKEQEYLDIAKARIEFAARSQL